MFWFHIKTKWNIGKTTHRLYIYMCGMKLISWFLLETTLNSIIIWYTRHDTSSECLKCALLVWLKMTYTYFFFCLNSFFSFIFGISSSCKTSSCLTVGGGSCSTRPISLNTVFWRLLTSSLCFISSFFLVSSTARFLQYYSKFCSFDLLQNSHFNTG